MATITQPTILEYAVAGTFYWTCPDDVYRIMATGSGGGGGGGGGSNNGGGGAGGNSGAWGTLEAEVVPGQTYTIVVGAKGAKGTSAVGAATAGGDGGDTYIMDVSGNVIAGWRGGTGGGGAPGTAAGVQAVIFGNQGQGGKGHNNAGSGALPASASALYRGVPGSTPGGGANSESGAGGAGWGNGANHAASGANGNDGQAKGGGGSGAGGSSAATFGGFGGLGYLIFRYM